MIWGPPRPGTMRASPVRGRLLDALRQIPPGRVASTNQLAEHLNRSLPETTALLAHLSDDERQACPWHRVVAKGGAIGRGPWRERQFALLIREGVAVSPAGIVQDMARAAIAQFNAPAPTPQNATQRTPEAGSAGPGKELPKGRSRGMKDRPGP